MANTRLTQLTENTDPQSTDLLMLVDDPGGSPESQKVTVQNLFDTIEKEAKSVSWFIPMTGVVDSSFVVTGEIRDVASALSGDYATDFAVGNQHVYILISSVGTGGDIVVTGTSLSEDTAVPVTADTETITVDTTPGQYYQTDKKWLEVTNVDVSGTAGIGYSVGVVGYIDFGNRDFTLLGYRAEFRSTSDIADIRLVMQKAQDDGSKKMSIVDVERIGVDSTNSNGQIYDSLRSGGNDRSYTAVDNLWPNDTMFVFKQGDLSTYFSSDENTFECASKAEGLIVRFEGEPSGGISAVDHCTLTLFYTLD